MSDIIGDEDALKELGKVKGLVEAVRSRTLENSLPGTLIAYCELVLEGLYSIKKIDRNEEHGEATYSQVAPERPARRQNFDDWGGRLN